MPVDVAHDAGSFAAVTRATLDQRRFGVLRLLQVSLARTEYMPALLR
jgi:hypothetical protein